MPALVDLHLARSSAVHRLDPRVKLLFVAGSLLLLLLFQNVLVMFVALLLLQAVHWVARMPWHKFAFVYRSLWPVCTLIFLLRLLFYPAGAVLAQAGIVQITVGGLAQGGALALRILAMAFAVFAWLYTTDQPSLVRSLVRLRVPYEWGLVLALALRYIPTFQGTFKLIAEAQQARALDLSASKGYRRVQMMMPIFVSMIIASLRASQQMALAMEARGFGASGVRRTSMFEIHFRRRDYLATVMLLLLFGGLIFLNLRYGFAADPVALWR